MTKRSLVAILLLLGCVGAVRAATERYTYQLRVAGRKFDITLGERFELDLPGGRPSAILQHGAATWSGHGVRFAHPGDMKVKAIDHRAPAGVNVVTIDVKRDDSVSVMMLLRPVREKTPAEALADAVEGMKMIAKRQGGAEPKVSDWQEKVAGSVRKGVRLVAASGEDPKCTGAVAFPFAGRVLVIGFRTPRSRRAEALAAFRTVAASLAVAGKEEEPAPAPKLELKIGSRTYPLEVDWPFDIEGPDGKTLRATLIRGRKSYAGNGIGFDYPGDMTTRVESKFKRVMIHVEHGDAYFADLQLHLAAGLEPEKVQEISVKFVRSSVESTGARFGPEKTCRLQFLGKTRTGTLLVTEGGDDPYRIEIYSFEIGGRAISVLFFCRESNRKTAKRAFQKIAKSLEAIG
jgi:hypothetical protein